MDQFVLPFQNAFVAADGAPSTGLLIAGIAIMLFLTIGLYRGRQAGREREEIARRTAEADARLAELLRTQTEMQGRLAAMADLFGARQKELNQSISQRLDGMTHRIDTSIHEQTKATHDNLRRLQERLAVIDAAQNNIRSLAKDVVGLQAILSNKQTRGAFGQSRMETIVADGLPIGAYSFQPTLSNGTRPDCTIPMPNNAPPLVIDAKFPLEAWNATREAAASGDTKTAAQQFRRDLDIHIRDIAQKYLIAGETHDMALLFVPSESIFADIHEHFESVVQKAHQLRVVIVSPSLLLLSIQVIQAVLKDQRMREQAHCIQGEVAHLMDDLARLDERVRKLQSHFIQAEKDVDLIATSADRLAKRGARIEAMEFAIDGGSNTDAGQTTPKAVESRSGLPKLRVVDED